MMFLNKPPPCWYCFVPHGWGAYFGTFRHSLSLSQFQNDHPRWIAYGPILSHGTDLAYAATRRAVLSWRMLLRHI
eukprot:1205772-Rhodomonas_salina.1